MPPKARRKAPVAAVSVLVPYRTAGDDHREQAWSFLAGRWFATHPTWELVTGDAPTEEWRKGLAVADALTRSSGEILVIADADVWCDDLDQAVAAVAAGAGWAVPHHRVLRLTAAASAEVYATGSWPAVRTTFTYAQRPYPGHPGGGIVVLRRDAYEVCPIDRRFAGWGQEDNSWALALRLAYGQEWRGTADLWHLWHQPQARRSRSVGTPAGAALHRRYYQARNNRAAMAQLVGELQ